MYNKILPNDHSEKKNDNLATGDYVRNIVSDRIVSVELYFNYSSPHCQHRLTHLTIRPLIANTDSHI